MYLKYTGTLDSACTITIAPNTMKRMQFIENGTSGSQNIIISQGSGANITIPPGDVKAVYLDGAGSGAAVVDAFASLSVVDLKVQDDLTVTDDASVGGTLTATDLLIDTDVIVTDSTNDRVGINQTSPSTTLDVGGSIHFSSILRATGDGSESAPSIQPGNDGDTGLFRPTANTIGFSTAGTERFRIASDGAISTPTAGTSNTRIGVNAGNSITSGGNYNVVVGDEAGTALTTGDANVAIGFEALSTEDEHGNNVAVGYQAYKVANAGGTGNNVGVGYQAALASTTATQNTLVGSLAGVALTEGSQNIAIGYAALDLSLRHI